jgi:lipopolysaccharide transport system ATP-binding protein
MSSENQGIAHHSESRIASEDNVAIRVQNLSKCYEIYDAPHDRLKQFVAPRLYRLLGKEPKKYFHEFWALKDISFEIKKGETFGIIGRNGSGKSTLLQLICGTLTPTNGTVESNGRIAALLELGSGFNPEFTGRENIYMNATVLGLSQKEIDDRFDQVVDFADIGEFIDQPVKTYSSGMSVRLAFAVAAQISPEILIVDEALAVGDAAFQRKCIAYMETFSNNGGVLLFVSHSLEQVRGLCQRVIYLNHGRKIIGAAKDICDMYEADLFGHQLHNYPPVNSVDPLTECNFENAENTPFNFPECALHYGNMAAKITRCWLSDIHGANKTTYQIGEKIYWHIQVKFDANCINFFCGFMIKTKEGINLFGTNTNEMKHPLLSSRKNEIMSFMFEINSHLAPGEYFLNCSLAQGDINNPIFIHRVLDAAIMTIQANEREFGGLVAMGVNFVSKKLR